MTRHSDLKAWETLSLAAATGSMTAAAAAMGLSVAAVSQQISRLERELGHSLLIRDQRGLIPTEAGKSVIGAWTRISADIQETRSSLAAPEAGAASRISLASVPTATASVLPQAIAASRRELPSMRLDVLPLPALAVYDAVTSRKADLGLTWHYTGEKLKTTSRLAQTPVFHDPLCIIASLAHPLAGRESVSLRDLAGEYFIGRHDDERGDRVLTTATRTAGFSPRIDIRTNDVPETQGLVAAGLGVAVTYGLTLLTMREDLCVLPMAENLLPLRHFSVIWLKPEIRAAEFSGIAGAIRDSAQGYYHELGKRIGPDWTAP